METSFALGPIELSTGAIFENCVFGGAVTMEVFGSVLTRKYFDIDQVTIELF